MPAHIKEVTAVNQSLEAGDSLTFLCMLLLLHGNQQHQRLLNLFSVSLNGRRVEIEIALIVSSQTNLHDLLCLYYQNHCSQNILISTYSTVLDLIEKSFFKNIFPFLHEGHRTLLIY